VAELAAGALALAVPVQLHVRPVRHQVVHPLVEGRAGPALLAGAPAEHVGHHHDRRGHRRGAQRVVEDGAQVLLELAGPRALDGPVPGVVRPHRELVDQDAVRRLEQLDGHDPDDADPVGHPHRELLGGGRGVLVQPGRGREHLGVDALALHGLDHRPDGDLPEGRAGDQRGELPDHRHPLLDQQDVVPAEELGDVVRTLDDEDAASVVAAARRLYDHRPAVPLAEGRHLVDGGDLGPGRLRLPGSGQRAAQDQLVLRVHQRVGPGRDPVTGRLEGAQVLGGNVLVVEGDHGGTVGDGQEGVEVAVVAEADVGGHQGCRLVGAGGEDPQRLAERDGCLVGHPGQLATADHGDDGQSGARVDGGGHGHPA
jgi:hypothetical protein